MTPSTIIQGWTPKTDFLLLCPIASSQTNERHVNGNHQHSGYDIIDHAFGKIFPASLLHELQSNGWIDDPSRGIIGSRLSPARTKTDVDLAGLLQTFGSTTSMFDDNNESGIRGDLSAFISRHERMKFSFPMQYPYLHKLVSSIEHSVCSRIGKQTILDNESFPSKTNTTYFEIDTNLTSVQIAKYVGDGKAGYTRHCDRGAVCLNELSNSSKMEYSNGSAMERILTCVYYVTPDWDQELDGGALRMFSPNIRDDSIANNVDQDSYFDVFPYADRLVVFRSDIIEHQVFPSLRRDRIAITVWLYGKVVHSGPNTEAVMSSSDELDLQPSVLYSNCLPKETESSLPPPLPVASHTTSCEDQVQYKSIFVAIPSYRDVETWTTIKSLVEMSCCPERIYIGVIFQVDTASEEETKRFTTAVGSGVTVQSSRWNEATNFRSIVMDYRHATGTYCCCHMNISSFVIEVILISAEYKYVDRSGPCYARHLAQTLHRGEDYALQIDSHMRFRPGWDEYLIQQLNKTKSPEKAVLTTYPPGYDPLHGPGPMAETRATILVPWKFEDGILRQKGRLLEHDYKHALPNDNIPCLLYAGGFNFFHSSILETCPYDSKLHGLFFGEEISMAVRLYTHGIDLYAPPQTVCYHLWKRNSLRIRVENDPYRVKRKELSLEVVRRQLVGLGEGIGNVRSVEQFTKALGVDFDNQTLGKGCEDSGLHSTAFVSSLLSGSKIENNSEDGTEARTSDEMRSVLTFVSRFISET
jgi:hypothetical protein